MSEPKHTPGPWHAVTIHPEGDSSGMALTYIRAIRDGHTEIAHVFLADILKRQSANARLIAAAPELLEALEALEGSLPNGLDCAHMNHPPSLQHGLDEPCLALARCNDAREAARAAIAKAKGETE